MKGFFENLLALSVKKLKKLLLILPSIRISGRGRAFPAESCRYMRCLAISNLYFLALSVKKLKKVLMILPSVSDRGRAFPAESCLHMRYFAINNFYTRWNFHAKAANPMINSLKVYHDDPTTLFGECYKLLRECQTSLRGAITNLPRECQMSLRGAISKLPREFQTKSLRGVINLSKDNSDPTSLKAPIKVEPCSNEL